MFRQTAEKKGEAALPTLALTGMMRLELWREE